MWILSAILFLLGVLFPLRCLFDEHDRGVLQEWDKAAVYSMGKLTGVVRSAGWFFTMPWQIIRKADTRVKTLDLPVERLATGGVDPLEFDVDLALYCQVADIKKFTSRAPVPTVGSSKGQGKENQVEEAIANALSPLVRGAMVTSLNATTENVLVTGGLPAVLKVAAAEVTRFCDDWGLEVVKLTVEDLGMPVALLEAAAARAKAKGESEALEILTRMRVKTFKDLKKAQGKFFLPLSVLKELNEMSGKGFGHVVGNMGDLVGLVGANLLDKEAAK